MKPLFTTVLLIAAAFSQAGEIQHSPEITVEELMAHADYLADDALQGRLAGSEGARAASDYIAAEFERLGLKPVGDGGTFFQGFPIPKGFIALPETALFLIRDDKETTFQFEREIYPAPCSAAGEVEGEAVFAGYGISAPDMGYDDYEGLDTEGKIVVVLRGLPNNKSSKNPFDNPQAVRRYAAFRAKLDTAAALGAKGLIVVNDPENHGSKSKDVLEVPEGQDAQGTIPCLRMTYAAGRRLVARTGVSLAADQKKIDSQLAPRSTALDGVRIRMNAALKSIELKVRNVAGLLESRYQGRKEETLIVGAHFDHIGLGEIASLGGSRAKGQVHNGADDNASGVAGVMEIAGFLAEQRDCLMRDVLFICFTAEEMGLLGSRHYVEAPLIPLAQTVAMVNLDMVSYLGKTKQLEIYGQGTSPVFEDLIDETNQEFRIKTRITEGPGSGMSDHAPFSKKGLPILFFITGLHKNYHRPTDDVKFMDKRGFEKVVRFIGQVTLDLALMERRPLFTPTRGGGELDTGPYLGIQVETENEGITVVAVAEKSPARKAGLKEKDILLELNNQELSSLSLFYGIWADVEASERVTFLVRRSGRLYTVRVDLKT